MNPARMVSSIGITKISFNQKEKLLIFHPIQSFSQTSPTCGADTSHQDIRERCLFILLLCFLFPLSSWLPRAGDGGIRGKGREPFYSAGPGCRSLWAVGFLLSWEKPKHWLFPNQVCEYVNVSMWGRECMCTGCYWLGQGCSSDTTEAFSGTLISWDHLP